MSLTDQEINDWAASHGGERFLLRFIESCLRSYEDLLWQQHQTTVEEFRRRAEGGWISSFVFREDGSLFTGEDPLFFEGGPPRHALVVGDYRRRGALLDMLPESQRLRIGMAHRKLRFLHERLYRRAMMRDRSYAWRFRRMYRLYASVASGEEDMNTAIIMGVTGTVVGIAGITSTLRGVQPGASVEPRGPVGRGGNTRLGVGPGIDDIGHAPTVPGSAAREGNTLPGVGPAIDDIGNAPTLPARPRSAENLVEDSTGGGPRPRGQRTPGGGLPPGGRRVAMTETQREAVTLNPPTGMENHQYMGDRSGFDLYASDWRSFGGEGPPPGAGFMVYNADGTLHYWATYFPGEFPAHLLR